MICTAATGVVVGIACGGLLGVLVTVRWIGAAPNASFILSAAYLLLLVAVSASLPPALAASFRDPVRALRVP